MTPLLGTLEKGKLANFIVTDGDLFVDKTKILETWVAGRRYEITTLPKVDMRGTWAVKFDTRTQSDTLIVSRKAMKLTVAQEIKKHGGMCTTFSDWWAYKVEAYDAIPYNGALMNKQGVVVSYNSDSAELARRLNTEATKAVKYGNVPPEEALKFITINAAKQLYIDDYVGSLEPGKDADFVVWSHSPLSTYSICEQTWIDGRKYFDSKDDEEWQKRVVEQRAKLVQKILRQSKSKKKPRLMEEI